MGRQTASDTQAATASSAAHPRTLRDYRDIHCDDTVLVCGCGVSLSQVTRPQDFITIGVNDVGRLFQPNYLVVLNPRTQFTGDRFQYVENSRASAVFTQLHLGIQHPNVVRFRLGRRGGVDVTDPESLPYTRNSPYVALCLALYMGARRIGLIGVDFTRDHFFAKTGTHSLIRELPSIDAEYRRLFEACAARDIELFNLSEVSKLTALPKISFDEFSRPPANRRSLNIVSYSVTPVAGVPVILSQCIAARTLHACRTVWATNSYGNGVHFDSDVQWGSAPAQAEELLRAADLFVVHNGKVDPRHRRLISGKPVITMAHNYMWNVDSTYVNQGMPGVVVGQYQATLPEFSRWHAVPNPLPAHDRRVQSEAKNPQITVCYTPSGKHERYPPSHRLYWHSKGYPTTMRVLNELARRHSIRLETISGSQVSHAQSLAMKQRSHIVIDECVTGSYHRNSLEGLAAGAVVVNGLGIRPEIRDVFCRCAGTDEVPFVSATLENLEAVLEGLIGQGLDALLELGARNRAWFEKQWDFEDQWNRFWEPVVDQALRASRHRGQPQARQPRTAVTEQGRISAVVSTGGSDRLRQLGTCLASLRQMSAVSEIILIDMGPEPFAEAVGRRWADQYFFVRNDDVFERARCLNIGTALAQCDLILWLDGDLLMSPDFLNSAVAEMDRRDLDFLVPFSQVNHLSAHDSEQVHAGTRNPADCPTETVRRNAFGGAGLVRTAFVRAHGAFPGGFRGWGGEDDAWWHKAKTLGHAAVTDQRSQVVYHLHHPHAGDFASNHRGNPHHPANLALLREMWSVKNRDEFLQRFPPLAETPWSWENKQILILSDPQEFTVDSIAGELTRLTGIRCESNPAAAEDDLRELAGMDRYDAVLILNSALAAHLLADDEFRAMAGKTIVLQQASVADPPQALAPAYALVCSPSVCVGPEDSDLCPWTLGRQHDRSTTAEQLARAILQPLSLLLSGQPSLRHRKSPIAPATPRESTSPFPIWMYWEGDCPEWIARCQKTAQRAAGDVRLLSADDFQKLRDSDLDIDLQSLHVAQRADFIRAYLLARFGGLWLDSDCVVMKPLDPLLRRFRHYDFVAHRERTANLWSNDLMAASPGSKIAGRLYADICQTLRSRRKIGWTDIGCQAVTRTIHANPAPYFELKVERVQPVCWSQNAPFLQIRTAEEHEKSFDEHAVCYMLSNLTMQKDLHEADLSSRLLRDGSFFRFLLDRSAAALGAPHAAAHRTPEPASLGCSQPATSVFSRITADARRTRPESLSGPGSSLRQTAEIRQRLPILFQDLGVRSVLDAGCGDCNWTHSVDLGLERYVAADIVPDLVPEIERRHTGAAIQLDVSRDPLPTVDLILCRDVLVLLPFDEIARAIHNFKRSGSRYLLATTFRDRTENKDAATGAWRPLNLQAAPFHLPAPLRVINEKCGEGGNRFSDKCLALWKLEDIPDPQKSVVVEAQVEVAVSEPTMNPKPAAHPEPVADPGLVALSEPLPHPVPVALSEPVAQPEPAIPADPVEISVGAYELAVVIPISVAGGQRERRRNLEACLRALNAQDLERSRYRIVVSEQDSERRLEDLCRELADQYIFAYNPNAFNKSWGFNLGACAVEPACALCLMDADMLPDRSFLRRGLEHIASGRRAVRPYEKVTYLEARTTEQALRSRARDAGNDFCPENFHGPSFPHAKGGCLFVDRKLFAQVGGFDERFRGFGYEDTEFWNRIERHAPIDRMPGLLLHMNHPRTVHGGGSNGHLFRQISSGRVSLWNGPMGGLQKYIGESRSASNRRNAGNGLSRDPLSREMIEAFTRLKLYCQNVAMESLSGPGSSLRHTEEIRRQIPGFLRELGVSSLLDCGCGDFHWMKEVDLGSMQYIGVELLDGLAASIQAQFQGERRRFRALNIVNQPLPKADVILCRDTLVHFPLDLVVTTLRNFKSSGSTYLLLTHFSHPTANRDAAIGSWRPLNFRLAPFNFPEPIKIIDEKCVEENGHYSDKCLALWRLADLEVAQGVPPIGAPSAGEVIAASEP